MEQLLPVKAESETRKNLILEAGTRVSARSSPKKDQAHKGLGPFAEGKKPSDFASCLKEAEGVDKGMVFSQAGEESSAGAAKGVDLAWAEKETAKTGKAVAEDSRLLEAAPDEESPCSLSSIFPGLVLNWAFEPQPSSPDKMQRGVFLASEERGQTGLVWLGGGMALEPETGGLSGETAGGEADAVVLPAQTQQKLYGAESDLESQPSSKPQVLYPPLAETSGEGKKFGLSYASKSPEVPGLKKEEVSKDKQILPALAAERTNSVPLEKENWTKPLVFPTYRNPESLKTLEIKEEAKEGLKGQELKGKEVLVENSDPVILQSQGQIQEPREGTSLEARLPRMQLKPQDIIFQVVKKAKLQMQGRISQMSIELEPRFLGRLTIDLTLQEGNLTARFLADNQEVKNLLEAGVAQLKTALEDSGFKVHKVEVAVDLGNSALYQGFEQQRYRQEAFAQSLGQKDPWITGLDETVVEVQGDGTSSWQEGALNILI